MWGIIWGERVAASGLASIKRQAGLPQSKALRATRGVGVVVGLVSSNLLLWRWALYWLLDREFGDVL